MNDLRRRPPTSSLRRGRFSVPTLYLVGMHAWFLTTGGEPAIGGLGDRVAALAVAENPGFDRFEAFSRPQGRPPCRPSRRIERLGGQPRARVPPIPK